MSTTRQRVHAMRGAGMKFSYLNCVMNALARAACLKCCLTWSLHATVNQPAGVRGHDRLCVAAKLESLARQPANYRRRCRLAIRPGDDRALAAARPRGV